MIASLKEPQFPESRVANCMYKTYILFVAAIFFAMKPANADVLNVKTWNSNSALNAKGDGFTDDAPAVQAAINSLTNGGVLYFPSGTYVLGATVVVGSSVNYALKLTRPNITIMGEGPGSVLLQTNFATTLIWANYSGSTAGLTIHDIKFQAETNGMAYSSTGWNVSGWLLACNGVGKSSGWSKYVRIKNVWTDDQGKRSPFVLNGVDDVVIENCTFVHYATTNINMGVGYPSIFIDARGIGSLRVANNFFDGGTRRSTWQSWGADGLIWQQSGDETTVTGNTIQNYKFEAIQMAVNRLTVTGNTFLGVANPSSVAVSITPNAVWQDTNIQVTVSGNVANGCLSFVSTAPTPGNCPSKIDCVIANNTVKLGDHDNGIYGWSAVGINRGNRVVIKGNTFDNYSNGSALIINGDSLPDSILNIEGNICTTYATSWENAVFYLNVSGSYDEFFRNILIQNNTLNNGGAGWHIFIYANNLSTNLVGRIIIGNNTYLTGDNVNSTKYIGIQNTSVQEIQLHPGTINFANYLITDLGPDY